MGAVMLTEAETSALQFPATPNFATPTATDACDPNPTLTFADVTTPGNCPQKIGRASCRERAEHCGNSSTRRQTINVVDTTGPVSSTAQRPTTHQCPAPHV